MLDVGRWAWGVGRGALDVRRWMLKLVASAFVDVVGAWGRGVKGGVIVDACETVGGDCRPDGFQVGFGQHLPHQGRVAQQWQEPAYGTLVVPVV